MDKKIKRYNGRTLTEEYAISSLSRKGVEFSRTDGMYGTMINIEKAKNLGNKSFGLIDFLVNHRNFMLSNRYSVLLPKEYKGTSV